MRRIIKERLALSNINDLVLCDSQYNLGLFGCIIDEQEAETFQHDRHMFTSIFEDTTEAIEARELFFRQKLDQFGSNLVGKCAEPVEKRTAYQSSLLEGIKEQDSRFHERNEVLFNELFRFRGILGQGSFGIVICVEDKFKPGETYALKIINKNALAANQIAVIHSESKVLKQMVDRPNVVQFVNIFETKKFIVIQMEHLKGS